MTNKTYEDGVRDGRIQALEEMVSMHGNQLDTHSSRLALLERIMWAGGGIVAFIEIFPQLTAFLT